jgi:hypothetical protein
VLPKRTISPGTVATQGNHFVVTSKRSLRSFTTTPKRLTYFCDDPTTTAVVEPFSAARVISDGMMRVYAANTQNQRGELRMTRLIGIAFISALAVGFLSGMPRNAQAVEGWYNCQATSVSEVGSGTNAILMVNCSNSYATGVNATALRLNTAAVGQPSRFLAMADAAVLSGRKFRVWMTDTACPGYSNCRLATTWSLYTL